MGRRKMLSECHRSGVRSKSSTRRARGSRFRRNRSPYGVSAVTNVFTRRARGVPDIIGGIFVILPPSLPIYIDTSPPPWAIRVYPRRFCSHPPKRFQICPPSPPISETLAPGQLGPSDREIDGPRGCHVALTADPASTGPAGPSPPTPRPARARSGPRSPEPPAPPHRPLLRRRLAGAVRRRAPRTSHATSLFPSQPPTSLPLTHVQSTI